MSRWWPGSVRRSTTLAAALVCFIVFALGWLGVRAFVNARLSIQDEALARSEVDRLATAVHDGRDAALSGDAMFVVLDRSGQVVKVSDGITRLRPQWTPPAPAPADAPSNWETTVDVTLRSVQNPQWREFRTYTAVGRVAGPFTVYLFVLPWNRLYTVQLLDDTMAFFVPLGVAIAALVAWLATRRVLRPVSAITRELARVDSSQLDRRVPMPPSRDEIAQLASVTNVTLERLQRAHDQQERFVADASHELRSPLASLRTGLEVALAHPDRADWPQVAERSLLDVQRLQRITTDLLQLAVEDSPTMELVDLADVVAEQVAERSLGDGPAVRSVVDGPALVRGELVQLERLLRNLLDNAVRHAAEAVTVTLFVGKDVALSVLDDGPGIPVHERERVFDRFVRLDDARARDLGGSGLGLTLARDIAARHGGTLTVEDSATGARFVARLPSAWGAKALP